SRGRFDQAQENFRRAIELDSENLRARSALAQEIERQAGPDSDKDFFLARAQQLIEEILEIDPDNLAAGLEVTRLAAKRGDADTLKKTVARISEKAAAWPDQAREQFTALQTAAESDNPRAAASRVAFLKNVLARVPEYRSDLAKMRYEPASVGEPQTSLLALPSPSPSPSPPDMGLGFTSEPLNDSGQWTWAGTVSLTGEGAPAIITANGREARLWAGEQGSRGAGEQKKSNPQSIPFPGGAQAIAPSMNGILGIDFNYDFKTDLALAGAGGVRLFQQVETAIFDDVTARTALPAAVLNAAYTGAWAADIELDGDLDIVLAAVEGEPVVLQNNGDGSFKEIRPFSGASRLRGFVYADLDGDGDPDAVTVDAEGRLKVYTNERGGDFHARAMPEELSDVSAIAVADTNADGVSDLIALQRDGSVWRISDKDEGRSWETEKLYGSNLDLTSGPDQIITADLDNNGAIDLAIAGSESTNIWLCDAEGKFQPFGRLEARLCAAADITGDGRLDFVGVSKDGQAVRLINRGTKDYHWQILRPRAVETSGDQRINSFGIGGEIEVRSGLLYQKQLIAGPLVHLGLGERTGVDVVRIVWPNGLVQAEFDMKTDQTVSAEQRLKGSCPSLFAWDGQRMAFVKDCAPWSPAIGLRINAQDTAGILQTEEWMKIVGDALVPRDGFYDLRITAELWETYYIDHYSLLVVDHPEGTEIFADERFAVPPPPLKVFATARPQPVSRALDDSGRDVTETISNLDGQYLDTFGRGDYQGVTRDHFLEITLPDDAPLKGPLWLIGDGWLQPTDASINVAISQGNQAAPRSLSLEVADGAGGWAVARENVGFPAGKNKTVLIDLEGVFRPNAPRRLRLRTNMEIYWDRLEWAEGLPDAKMEITRLKPEMAELRYRGFSVMERANRSSPELPDYNRLAQTTQRWRDLEGYYTRHGDIRELIDEADDRIVIVNAGDEMAFRFKSLPAPPAGITRDYVLIGNGWIKDGDYNSVSSKTVLPLPLRERTNYTGLPGKLEDDPAYRRHSQDWQNYHTRYETPERFRNALVVRRGAGEP
ncbi:MAG: FG-GAP-like repeat-containing protein, partial [Blastocatellia bacterium]|nr:FG-GAP-like repeat-containing protein [Blastocatellia bacterium]